MEDQLPHFIELVDENNVITTFEYRMSLDYNNREYIVLACPEEDTDSGEGDEIVILRVEQGLSVWREILSSTMRVC